MSGASLKIKLQDVLDHVFGVAGRVEDDPALLRIAGGILVTSVQRNFEKGGRPEKWAALSKTTLARRKGSSPLVVKGMAGGLLGSIHYQVEGDVLRVGTNKVYAATHQFGAKQGAFGTVAVKVSAHTRNTKRYGQVAVPAHERSQKIPWGDIPARPFLVVQDGDRVNIQETLQRFALEGRK